MNRIRAIIFLGASLSTLLYTAAFASTANPWHLVIDPVDQFNGLIADPSRVIEFNTASDSFSEFSQIVSTPIEVDGFERIDDENFYFSVDIHADFGNQTASPADVFLIDTAAGTVTKALDATADGIPDGVNVDAITLAGNGDLVISIDTHANLGGNTYDDADLIRFDGSGFSLFIDGSDLGLDDAADIDAVTRFSNDRIVLSTKTGGSAGSIVYNHSDMLFVDDGGTIKRIELSMSDETGTSSDVRALSGVELPDELFRDRFESK